MSQTPTDPNTAPSDQHTEVDEAPVGRWVLVANVGNDGAVGQDGERLPGTKHFSAGTKVYGESPRWGDGWEKTHVLGRHRGSKAFVEMVIPVKRLENFRAKREYNPHVNYLLDVVCRFSLGGYTEEARHEVEEWARVGNDRLLHTQQT